MKKLAWRTVLPAMLAILLFSGVVFLYLLPALDRVVMDQKRLMIRELTESSWNILARFAAEEKAGAMTTDQARTAAIAQVRNLHYGQQSKDYFFIIDNHPHMVVHPYRPDLEGKDLSAFADPEGRHLFVEMVDIVHQQDSGYVHYMWQWKDDSQHIVPKISFVKGFQPWGWIIGTGVYTQDIDEEIAALKANLQLAALTILAAVSLLLFILLRASFQAEAGRLRAAAALSDSEVKYRSLVESAGEAIVMSLAGQGLYANASLLHMLGYERAEFAQLDIADIILQSEKEKQRGYRFWQAIADGQEAPRRYEAELATKGGAAIRVMLTLSRIVVQGKEGFMAVAARLSQPRQLDVQSAENLDDLEAASRRTRDLGALMMKHGTGGVEVSRLLSDSADAVVRKAVDLIVAQQGPAPVPFDFMLMGSLGRREVTLLADQDHAIIHADVPEAEMPAVQEYFLAMGSKLSDLLDGAGYPYCRGKIMASEKECCQSLSGWCATFDRWVTALQPDDLLRAKIFFDFRGALGENHLVGELRQHLDNTLAQNPLFFPLLAHSILHYEPPLGTFGGFATNHGDGLRQGFDIKGVLAQVVDVARLRSLQNQVSAVGTLERLQVLSESGHLRAETADDTENSFRFLLRLRLWHQARLRTGQLPLDNLFDPDDPANLDDQGRRQLKQVFGQIKALQESLKHEFGARP